MAMAALKIGVPEDYMQLLKEHTDIVNLPRIGTDENIAFPVVQANIVPAVALKDALGIYNCPHLMLVYSYYLREGT